jgi:signal transduction histidine kinase
MLEQPELSERSSPSGFPPCRPWTPPARKPLPSLTTLVARMSHDIRTPLAAILANAEFLAQSDLSEEVRDELYEEIRLSVDLTNELVSDLLESSKGVEVLRPAIGNIVETTERVMRMIGVRPAFRGITITHRHEGSAIGWYNSGLLERAVSNVVLNACEAVSPESGQVAITTLGGQACLRIDVWDNGPGIPQEIQDSVFRPFFTYGKSEGTGLGLAIAKRIVEDHGGELLLDAGEKTGTSFKISIPFAIPEEAITRSSIRIGPSRPSGEARV